MLDNIDTKVEKVRGAMYHGVGLEPKDDNVNDSWHTGPCFSDENSVQHLSPLPLLDHHDSLDNGEVKGGIAEARVPEKDVALVLQFSGSMHEPIVCREQ